MNEKVKKLAIWKMDNLEDTFYNRAFSKALLDGYDWAQCWPVVDGKDEEHRIIDIIDEDEYSLMFARDAQGEYVFHQDLDCYVPILNRNNREPWLGTGCGDCKDIDETCYPLIANSHRNISYCSVHGCQLLPCGDCEECEKS